MSSPTNQGISRATVDVCCSHCSASFKVSTAQSGSQARCLNCKAFVDVPYSLDDELAQVGDMPSRRILKAAVLVGIAVVVVSVSLLFLITKTDRPAGIEQTTIDRDVANPQSGDTIGAKDRGAEKEGERAAKQDEAIDAKPKRSNPNNPEAGSDSSVADEVKVSQRTLEPDTARELAVA